MCNLSGEMLSDERLVVRVCLVYCMVVVAILTLDVFMSFCLYKIFSVLRFLVL